MNKILIGIVALLLVIGGFIYFVMMDGGTSYESVPTEATEEEEMIPVEPDGGIGDGAEPLPEIMETETVIGRSVDGQDITAYHFGEGEKEVLFIGGIHGGYSWNTALVAYQLMGYLDANEANIPEDVMVTVIPVLNPDGLEKVVGTAGAFSLEDVPKDTATRVAGRFNADDVDLNRNFDCQWQEQGTWQNKTVSGGDEPFSEPESRAVRDYVETHNIEAVVAWYSAAGGVYASQCDGPTMAKTLELTNVYADASGYTAHEEFNFYEITGDMVNWLAAKKIPAISVLLTTHEDTEWSKNLKGIEAVLNHVAE